MGSDIITFDTFYSTIMGSDDTVLQRAFSNSLAVPNFKEFCEDMKDMLEEVGYPSIHASYDSVFWNVYLAVQVAWQECFLSSIHSLHSSTSFLVVTCDYRQLPQSWLQILRRW